MFRMSSALSTVAFVRKASLLDRLTSSSFLRLRLEPLLLDEATFSEVLLNLFKFT